MPGRLTAVTFASAGGLETTDHTKPNSTMSAIAIATARICWGRMVGLLVGVDDVQDCSRLDDRNDAPRPRERSLAFANACEKSLGTPMQPQTGLKSIAWRYSP